MAFRCGDRPIWELPLFRDLVLGNSMAKDPAELAPAPSQGTPLLRTLIDALTVVSAQLQALESFGYAAPPLRRTVGRVHAAFARALEMCVQPLFFYTSILHYYTPSGAPVPHTCRLSHARQVQDAAARARQRHLLRAADDLHGAGDH